jgi:hypothetical protein
LNALKEAKLIEPEMPAYLREYAKEKVTIDLLDRYIDSLKETRLVPLVPMHFSFLMAKTETILPWKSTFGCYSRSSILAKNQTSSDSDSCRTLL